MGEPDEALDSREEMLYERGSRAAWLLMLQQCCKHLGYDDPEVKKAGWIQEREWAVQQLRTVCAEFGDNDWPNDLHLMDVIEKHLYVHLMERE